MEKTNKNKTTFSPKYIAEVYCNSVKVEIQSQVWHRKCIYKHLHLLKMCSGDRRKMGKERGGRRVVERQRENE